MRDLTATQQIINQQMQEQLEAMPLPHDICLESNPRPKAFMDSLMNQMHENIRLKIDRAMLENNPAIQIKGFGDKIKVRSLPANQLYIKDPNREDVWHWPKLNKAVKDIHNAVNDEDSKVELTLINGVYE